MCSPIITGPVRTSEAQVMQNMHELNLRFCTSTSHVLDWVDACPNLVNLRAQLFRRGDEQDDPEIDEFGGLGDEIVEDDEPDGEGWVLINNRRQRPAQNVLRISTMRNDVRVLPNLTCLELHSFSSPASVGTILDPLTTPALKILRIGTSFARIGLSNVRWLHIALLLQRSDASLEELRTAGTPMNADDMRACLLLSPRLKRLSIGMFEEMEQLLGDLAAQTSEGEQPESKLVAGEGTQQSAAAAHGGIPLPCPGLNAVDIADSIFPIDALVSVVSSRFPAGGHVHHASDSQSEKQSESESSDGPDLGDHKRLERICVDKTLLMQLKNIWFLRSAFRRG
ncbi:uncharacterized protein FOMMEDRAFT_28188 [Fomitiporia mediterranea MF3/22]|uniref:uncharacterized protein n=1 Tax=Fomitiporia mediterranea (strain MF3/22) TaxID=694068 RepID=UPI00044093CA|nr:uncharacterized protein FOMMEDRAFT_28188 [Fomitiporia mediterranea MF3/22]EJD04510.1 hypothetical protein FOMMEDRAFT_28188 [Fomitiporia mediterranea MF3/22]